MSIFNVNISYFKNVESVIPVDIPLRDFLTSDKHRKTVELVRSCIDKDDRKRIKLSLPAATISCRCKVRNGQSIIEHSGFLAFDIDDDHNYHIKDWPRLRDWITLLPEVCYTSLSVSGEGVWGMVRIKYPDRHEAHFRALESAFKANGIVLDPRPKKVISLRIYSYDHNAYFNENAVVFDAIEEAKYNPVKYNRFIRSGDAKGEKKKVEECIKQIQAKQIDITAGIDGWLRMGASFSNAFGESGREYFHAISQFHPDYSRKETDEKFDTVTRNHYTAELNHFFARCRNNGIYYKETGYCISDQSAGERVSADPDAGFSRCKSKTLTPKVIKENNVKLL